jgi:hypothetical protein
MLNFQWLKGKETRIMGPETGSSTPISAALVLQFGLKRQENGKTIRTSRAVLHTTVPFGRWDSET